jgi:purine nucleoside phosphorylase
MNELMKRLDGRQPKTAIILGSSLGPIADAVKDPLVIPYTELLGFPVPKISGHAGKLVVGDIGGAGGGAGRPRAPL